MGLYQVAVGTKQDERLKALYGFTVFGFALTWIAGWWMMKHLGYSMGALGYPMRCYSVWCRWWVPSYEHFLMDKNTLYNGLIWVGFALSIAAMVVRTGDSATLGLVSAVSVVFGALMAWRLPVSNQHVEDDVIASQVIRGFKWMAWVEGMTVLVLFLLYLPAKKLLEYQSRWWNRIDWLDTWSICDSLCSGVDVYVSKTPVVLGAIHRWGTVFISTVWHLHL